MEKRSTCIANESHKKICKFIFRGNNVERGIVDVLKQSCPEELSSVTSSMVSKECKELCKRSNDTVLQNRSKDGILNFSWDKLHQELQIRAPHTLKVVSSIVTDIPHNVVQGKPFYHVLNSVAIALHGRSREMTVLQYLCGMVLLHGGCTHRDIERLAKIGLTVTAETLRRKMVTWEEHLDVDLIKLRDGWIEGDACMKKYQLVGDNWDKNIVPSFRTSQQKTISLHLFNIIGVLDRIQPAVVNDSQVQDISDCDATDFIPSVEDQKLLCEELTFIVATSIIGNIDQMTTLLGAIYPKHLKHEYSDFVGLKTQQHALGLFDCNETKTQDVIRMLKEMTRKYVPIRDEEIVEEVFFGGDRLTDERIQTAQEAMVNNEKATDRLEGFISKIEDFHRLMNFLEAIWKLTYSTNSGKDRGTAYYYRNLLNARNVKKDVKNSYRAYKFLYYSIFDAICCALFLKEMQINSMESEIPIPLSWKQWSNDQKIEWMNSIAQRLVKRWFFDSQIDDQDLLRNVRDVLSDPDHPENYWTSNVVQDRFKCHYCDKTYVFIGSLKTHEKSVHQHVEEVPSKVNDTVSEEQDELHDHMLLQFRLIALHKNLDTAVDMGDGKRAVRSAKYETPIYNLTNKTKYLIGSVHLTGLVSGTLPKQQSERLIANRCINITGGKNNNIALDEYVELLNRETKDTCSGFQTKESIIAHSKEFPHLIDAVKHFDSICEIRQRKGFHKLPSYKNDVKKVVNDLLEIKALDNLPGRSLRCRSLVRNRNPYKESYRKLVSMIHRHKPSLPFRRLRNKRL
ncbi:uncharacterized protein LOC117342076 [Pecten maximus]|uniref:uncharacterized protein LOC117342076 n=1 Tax=Pecten maximus TaxID=6579 RepID=UPI001458901A|nr:uncharacterized protein LOC117342076 [Pecten maximus]